MSVQSRLSKLEHAVTPNFDRKAFRVGLIREKQQELIKQYRLKEYGKPLYKKSL